MDAVSRNDAARPSSLLRLAGVDYLRTGLRISLWLRWFVVIAWLVQLHHQVNFAHPAYVAHTLFAGLLLAVNTYVLYRFEARLTVTWRWVLALSSMDVVMLTAGLTIATGSGNSFFVMYYAALAMFASACTSFRTAVAGATLVTAVHLALSVAAEPRGAFEIWQDQALLTGIITMYAVVAAVSLVTLFERTKSRSDRQRRREAVQRERELQLERTELSQTIHNTIAQSAYLIGLGLETAIELADAQDSKNKEELSAKLNATLTLSKSTMWELRHPIDAGAIFEGRELSRVLRSHASSFSTITSIPTELVQTGLEPRLPTATRRRLFSIAHNAMTNALRHSQAGRITIELVFDDDVIRLSVSDDGIGIPDDYEDRGHGFRNMRADAERMGGWLEAGPGESGRGAAVTCVLPCEFWTRRRMTCHQRR